MSEQPDGQVIVKDGTALPLYIDRPPLAEAVERVLQEEASLARASAVAILRATFVAGARWSGGDNDDAEAEAERRYPDPNREVS